MLNIFHNINVIADRDDTNQGQFRYAVCLVRYVQATGWSFPKPETVKIEYVIDTTDNLYDCQLVAEGMVKDENEKTRRLKMAVKLALMDTGE
jgi:hypothetical protein